MKRALVIAAISALAALAAPAAAFAQRTQAMDAPADEGELLTQHRLPPDYDSRDDPGPDEGEVLLWFPRILFAPVTFVLDYLIRRPLEWLVTTAERENWDELVLDLLTWNERRSGIVPTVFIAYGLQPSAGLMLFSNDDIAPGHSVHVSVATGGGDFLQANGSYAIYASDRRVRLDVAAEVGRRPDRVFSGIGWDAPTHRYRFREDWYDAHMGVRADFWRQSRFTLRAGVDGHEFDPDGYAWLSDSGSLEDAIANNAVQQPYGLDEPYVVARPRAEIALDTREREPAPGHGVRIDAHVEMPFDLYEPHARRWVRWGGGAGGFVDLGDHRVLALWTIVRFADPLGSTPIPFTDLVALGQDALLMQGFLRGQLRGRSAVAATLEYVYPVWSRLDGRLHLSVGNAFDAHLSDFLLERLRLSFGIGIATAGDPDDAFEITIATGTAPFVLGTSIESVQLLFGSRRGF